MINVGLAARGQPSFRQLLRRTHSAREEVPVGQQSGHGAVDSLRAPRVSETPKHQSFSVLPDS